MANNNHFNLQLDTTSPSGSVSRSAAYSTAANITVKPSCTASDVKYMKVWLTGKTSSNDTTGTWEAYSASKTITVGAEDTYTAHAIFMDDIGNESSEVTSDTINYDKTAPTKVTFTVKDPSPVTGQPDDETNSLTNDIVVKFEDKATDTSGTPSGIARYEVSCDAFASTYSFTPNDGDTYSGTVAFKTGTTQGSYTITCYAYDNAGNKSAAATVSLYYDDPASEGACTLKIYKDSGYTKLCDFINVTTIYNQIEFASEPGESSPHIVGYKLWEEGTSEPTAWTSMTKGTATVKISKVFVSGEGTVQWNAQGIDDVGNVTAVATYSFVYDKTNPTATLSASESKISTSGTIKESVLTFSASDTNIASYKVTVNGTEVTSGTENVSAGTYTVSASTSGMVEGSNTITLTVTDKAGNVSTATATITLDTSAPTATFTSPDNIWYNKNNTDPNTGTKWETTGTIKVTASKECTGYFWFSSSKDDTNTNVPSGAVAVSLAKGENTISTSQVSGNVSGYPSESASSQYIHVKLEDSVGNTGHGVTTDGFKFDATAPSKPTVTWSKSAYADTAAQVSVTCDPDSYSGLAYFRFRNVIDTEATVNSITDLDWHAWSAATNYSLTLTATEGHKKIQVQVRDTAGNASEWSDAACTELDTTKPSGSLSLKVANSSTAKPSPSNIAATDMLIALNDDTIEGHGNGSYKIWGDIDGEASTEATASWVAFSAAGSQTITLHKACTSGDGTKNFYVKLKDNAGNESDTYSASFVYDTTAPIVYASSDYAKISKVHSLRWSAANVEIEGKYNDQVNVTAYIVDKDGSTTQTSEKYIAWKAVAYADADAAKTGSASDAAIEGCSGTYTTPTSAKISTVITGEAFEKALNGGTTPTTAHAMDGSHIVTIYIQDEAGTWSEAATFSA